MRSAIKTLSQRRITYLHLIEGRGSEISLSDNLRQDSSNNAQLFWPAFDGTFVSAGAYTPQTATKALSEGHADAVAFGPTFIANSDLAVRIRDSQLLNAYDRSTFYGGGEHGYTDYPLLHQFDWCSEVSV